MEYKSILTYIALAVITILYLRSCSGTSAVETEVEVKVDTVYTKGVPDTIMFHDTIIEYKYLTSTVIDSRIDTITNDTVHTYRTVKEDSLLKATIISEVAGSLKNISFSYVPKFPKYITRVDTLRIDSTTTITKQKWGLYAGAVVGGNTNKFTVAPSLILKTNKGLQVSAGYELIDKTYNFGIFTVIKNPFKK
jgi:hypothetical protein